MFITAQVCRLRNDLYCVEWDVKLYYTIPYLFRVLVLRDASGRRAMVVRSRGPVTEKRRPASRVGVVRTACIWSYVSEADARRSSCDYCEADVTGISTTISSTAQHGHLTALPCLPTLPTLNKISLAAPRGTVALQCFNG